MNKSTIRKEIAVLIDSIKEHSDNIGENKHIPQLELEMILNKIKKLYEKSIIFNHLNSVSDSAPVEQIQTKIKEESKNPLPITFGKPIHKELSDMETEKKEVKIEETKTPNLITPVVDLFGAALPPTIEKPKQEKKAEIKADKIEVKSVIPNIHKPAISDLSKAIGINDKFQFANELFSGNMQEYSIAIQQLNSCETLESAMDYFSNLQQLYEWDSENQTVKRLLDLVDRRYSA
ncbi:MAG: hypothetical protein A3F72_19535 [Bacteroidetes bacterium RIFCSPLOWO2_12_FULL_35_15]|nr:MAG: hypothetical protein A3F72_19535 [Bacteroidetes bacterium RIFCSPLOWO2_12_FULL_35_15]